MLISMMQFIQPSHIPSAPYYTCTISHNLWNPDIQCRIHKGSPTIPILSQINPIPHIHTYYFKIHSIIALQSTLWPPKGLFHVSLPVKILKELVPSSILTTWPVQMNLVDLTTLTIFDDKYKVWSFSLWSLLHSPFSSVLNPNIRLKGSYHIAHMEAFSTEPPRRSRGPS